MANPTLTRQAVNMMAALLEWARWAIRLVAGLVVVLLMLAAVGVSVPSIPVIGFLGTVMFPMYGSWELLLSVALGGYWFRCWRVRARKGAALLSVVAAGSATYLGWNTVDMMRKMQAQNVPVAFGPSLITPGSDEQAGAIENVAYGDKTHPLNLLVYPRKALRPHETHPILVYVHGGGWIGGTSRQRAEDMRWFAGRGMLVISLDYTLSTARQHLWDRTEAEIGCGLAWVAQHASHYGGDPGRIVLFGDSAGGNLVINSAYRAATGRLSSSCGGIPQRPRAVIASYPVVDAADFYHNRDILLGRFSRMMAGGYTGGSPEAVPQRYAAIASAAALNPAAPPTLIFVPEADHLVPPAPSFAFVQSARSAGITIRLVVVPNADHGFEAGPQGSIGNQILHEAAWTFLKDNGLLNS